MLVNSKFVLGYRLFAIGATRIIINNSESSFKISFTKESVPREQNIQTRELLLIK